MSTKLDDLKNKIARQKHYDDMLDKCKTIELCNDYIQFLLNDLNTHEYIDEENLNFYSGRFASVRCKIRVLEKL